jgi:xanthine dehydrogenase accessory factor
MLNERQKGSLLTIVMGSKNKIGSIAHCLATVDGEIVGDFPLPEMELKKVLAVASESTAVQTLAFNDAFMVVETTLTPCTAYLFGAGHVAQSTAAIAATVGFRVSVTDDREEYAKRERFRDASEIRVIENFEHAFSGLSVGREDFVVILTRGHLHDKTVLAQALRTGAGYIGMIGSRKKRSTIYGALLKEGIAQVDIDRVHSPIGLSIGAETPEEIAISIVAELIAVRAGRRPY